MLNKLVITAFLSLVLSRSFASLKSDSLVNILQSHEAYPREKKLVNYIRDYFQTSPISRFHADEVQLNGLLLKYGIHSREAYNLFVECIYSGRYSDWDLCGQKLIRAIEIADKNEDHYLLFTFFTQLAFVRTYQGNVIEAMSCFRLAKKEAEILKDNYLEVLDDINISDLCYRNSFYKQSIFYLDQAETIMKRDHINEQRLYNVIYYNKAENYFRIKNIDSLSLYNGKLRAIKDGTYKINTFRNRTDYYMLMLRQHYKGVINSINALKKSQLYEFDDLDEQNLADAYLKNGQGDSAKAIINHLLTTRDAINHPEIRPYLYFTLGEIEEQQGNYPSALIDYRTALILMENRIGKLAQVGNVSSQMRIDDIQNSVIKKEEAYDKERTWFIFAIVVILLTTGIITISYRNIKQKRHYERLLFNRKKEELAFINSHDVRKHLSNILGMMNLVKHSENRNDEYLQVEDRLYYSIEKLDNAIRDISSKLDN